MLRQRYTSSDVDHLGIRGEKHIAWPGEPPSGTSIAKTVLSLGCQRGMPAEGGKMFNQGIVPVYYTLSVFAHECVIPFRTQREFAFVRGTWTSFSVYIHPQPT